MLIAARRNRKPGGLTGIRIEVRDSGIGIAPANHTRIFEEFYQVANAQRGRRRGFGLGLAICARIAALLGTRIAVRSALEKGSTFSLVLPIAKPGASLPTDNLPIELASLIGLRCLMVDDDEIILEAIRTLLNQWGCETESATSTAAALSRMRAQGACFDVILCDLQLAGPDDGMVIMHAARQLQPQALAVIVTGAADIDTLQRLRQEGVPLLTKPVAPAKLRTLLTKQRNRSKEIST